jgi:hypothetical protein
MNIHDNSDSSRKPVPSSTKQLSDEAQNIKMAEGGDAIERVKLATNLGLSRSLQSILLQDKEESVLVALASNQSLHEDVQGNLLRTGILAVQISLATNRNLSEALMKILAASDIEDVRAGLACNTSLPESLQALLIADSSIGVRENIARNSTLKIAQQKQMASVGNVDIRLALLDNPSLVELVRMRVVASFTGSDLASMERDIHSAERKSDQLYSEHKLASQKCVNSYGALLPSSDEKIEELTGEVDRIQNQINAADKEIDTLKIKYRKIFSCLYPGETPRPV